MATNNPSPLIPQGTFLAAPGKSHVRIAVFTILAIHVIMLGALLLQGCKRSTDSTALPAPEPTNALTRIELPELPPLPPPPLPDSTTLTQPSTPPPGTAPTVPSIEVQPEPVPSTPSIPEVAAPSPERATTPVPAAPTPQFVEHTIVAGDTFSALATKYKTTTRAIEEANPNVDPRRLQVGKKILIPPAPAPTAPATTEVAVGPNQVIYTVQSNDTLSKIARRYNTTVKDIMTANNLTTTNIRVGQKLVVPKP